MSFVDALIILALSTLIVWRYFSQIRRAERMFKARMRDEDV